MSYIKAHKSRVPLVMAARVGRITGVFRPRQEAHLDVYLENTTQWVVDLGPVHVLPDGPAGAGRGGGVAAPARGRVPAAGTGDLGGRHRAPSSTAATRFRATAEGAFCLLKRRWRWTPPWDGGVGCPRDRHGPDPRLVPSDRRRSRRSSSLGEPIQPGRGTPTGRWLRSSTWALRASWPRRVIVVLAVVVGFGLRLAWVVYAARKPAGLHDPYFYLDYGRRMAQGGGYRLKNGQPTAYYPIGYPAILAAWFWIMQLSACFPNHWIVGAPSG